MSVEQWRYLEETSELSQGEERMPEQSELSDAQWEELARERLWELRESENAIDRAISRLPDTPETRELQTAIAWQRRQIHETGRDIWNAEAERTPEEFQRAILVFPEILTRIIEMLRNMFSLWEETPEKESVANNTWVNQANTSEAMRENEDSLRDSLGYISLTEHESYENVADIQLDWEAYRFWCDPEQWFLFTGERVPSGLSQMKFRLWETYYLPFSNTGSISIPGGGECFHVEVWGSFYEHSCDLLESYLWRVSPELLQRFSENKYNPEWLSDKDIALFPYISGVWELLQVFQWERSNSYALQELFRRLPELLELFPDVFSIDESFLESPELLEANFTQVHEQFITGIREIF